MKTLSFAVSYWKWLRSAVPGELLIFAGFVLSHLIVANYKPYSIIITVYIALLVLVTKSVSSSLWFAILGTLFFFKAKYFSVPFVSNVAVNAGLATETPFIYYTSFSMILLILLIFIIFRTRKGATIVIPLHREFILLALFLLIGSVSSALSAFGNVSWFSLFIMIEYILLFFTSIIMCSDKKVFRATILMIMTFIILNGLLIILQKMNGGPIGIILEDTSFGAYGRFPIESPGLYRPGGIYFEPNLPASLINLVLPLSLYYFFTRIKGFVGVTIKMLFFILLTALVSTASRANWLIALASVLATAWCYRKKVVLTATPINRTVVVAVIIVSFFFLPTVYSRIASIPQSLASDSGGLQFRLRHLAIAGDIMNANVFGVGLDVFQYHILDHYPPAFYYSHFTAPHNLLAEVGSATGFIGLGVFVSFFVAALYRLMKNFFVDNTTPSGINTALLIGYGTYLLSAQVYPWLFAPPLSELSWIILGCLYAKTVSAKT